LIPADDIRNRFAPKPLTGADILAHVSICNHARELATAINGKVPDGREKSLAITHLEQAVMWAAAALARHDTDNDMQEQED
jgi:hypothetical protein